MHLSARMQHEVHRPPLHEHTRTARSRRRRGSLLCRASPARASNTEVEMLDITNGSRKMYKMRANHPSQSLQLGKHDETEEARPAISALQAGKPADLLAPLETLFLPQGWPHSVTPDYLPYQLWTFPSHVTGWMSHALASSSMLKALGVGTSPAATVGFSAGIKWVTKDGIGALGRFFVGSRLGTAFDEDPKRWRMIAEAVTTLGLALEVATQLYPAQFVVLAGAGTLAKATGKGMGRPCFRVVQTYFGASNNVGDVAAKEEVWEVTAQLVGLAASVAVLSLLDVLGMPEAVVPTWAAVHGVHVALRYNALRKLRFPWPNFKRGAALLRAYVLHGRVLSVDEAHAMEPMLTGPADAGLDCVLGCSLEETVFGDAAMDLHELLELYGKERYVLAWHDGTAYVLLWENAEPLDVLRAMWQATWVQDQLEEMAEGAGVGGVSHGLLHRSLQAMQTQFPSFESKAGALGWQLHRAVLPVGKYRLAR